MAGLVYFAISVVTLILAERLAFAEAVPASTFTALSRRLLAEDQMPESQPQPAASTETPQIFWVLLVGDSNTGKTSLVNRLLTDTFLPAHHATEGAYSKQHSLQLGGRPAQLQVWDTAGQEAFRKAVTSIYRHVQAVLITFDPHDRTSFESAQQLWLPEVKEFAALDSINILVSTKNDMANATVSAMEAQGVANASGVEYITTSALNNQNVTSLFQRVGEDILARRQATAQS